MTVTNALDIAKLVGEKFAGYTLDQFLDCDADCHWFDSHADNGTRTIVYLYRDEHVRDQKRAGIHGFLTCSNELVGDSTKVFISVGDHRLMMPGSLREALRSPGTRPREVAGYEIEDVLGHGYKGITFKVRQKAGPKTPPPGASR